jgi:AI-2 transport protein TqsA
VIGPRVLSRGLDVSTIVTFLTVMLFGFILGGIGALLALPIVVLIKIVILEHYPESRWMATAIGGALMAPAPLAAPDAGAAPTEPAPVAAGGG